MYVCMYSCVEMGIYTIIVMHCAPIKGEKTKNIEKHCLEVRSMRLHITYGGCYLDTMPTFTTTTNKQTNKQTRRSHQDKLAINSLWLLSSYFPTLAQTCNMSNAHLLIGYPIL
jgi:hypothetical protein